MVLDVTIETRKRRESRPQQNVLSLGPRGSRDGASGAGPAPPLSLQGSYQLVTLSAEGDTSAARYAADLERALATAMRHIGVNATKMLAHLGSQDDVKLDRRLPAVAVFFGTLAGPILSCQDSARLDRLLDDGTLIIPVVEDIDQFDTMVPGAISHLNGLGRCACGAEFECLAAHVLEGFGLLRERRRLFIGYCSFETGFVAAQICQSLEATGFDVFLDAPGPGGPVEPFQEILWHRLTDTDIILLLGTPEFLASWWIEEEFARANTANLQILQVLWPGQEETSAAAFSTFHRLSMDDFEDGVTLGPAARLGDGRASDIVDGIEGLRARAFAARQAFLVREFVMQARQAGLQAHMARDRSLVLRRDGAGDEKTFVLPAVGVPDAERYEALEQAIRQEFGQLCVNRPHLLHDESGIRARWLEHLRWLNGNLDCVSSVALWDAEAWLRAVADGSEG